MSEMFAGCTEFNQPVSFDTQNVTKMYAMFEECTEFNQPVSFDTQLVTDMSEMFAGCTEFNKPITFTNTENVTDMDLMFAMCSSFDQNISGWNVARVIDTVNIFEECPIQEGNKPIFTIQPDRVDAIHVHKHSSNINYQELNEYLEQILNVKGLPSTFDAYKHDHPDMTYTNFIKTVIQSMIDKTETNQEIRKGQLDNLVAQRLNIRYDNFSPQLVTSIYCTLTYASIQSILFINTYIDTLLGDCSTAYNGSGEDALSCPRGILERFALCLVDASTVELTAEPRTISSAKTAEYETIIKFLALTPATLIPIVVKDWYKMKTSNRYPPMPDKSNESEYKQTLLSRKQDLENYIDEQLSTKLKITREDIPDLSSLIEKWIPSDLEYYEDDSFQYTAGTRRKRKRKTTRKRRR